MAGTTSVIHLIIDLNNIPGTETEISAAVDCYENGKKTMESCRISYDSDLDNEQKILWDDFVQMIELKRILKTNT